MTEEQALRNDKICCSCKHFIWFMGSAGYCGKQRNKISDMIDAMGSCHNGCYKYKYPTPKFIFWIQRSWYCVKSKFINRFIEKKEVSILDDIEW